MLNKLFWTTSKLSVVTLVAVGSMLSVGSFAQDNEYVEEVVSIGTRGKPRSVSSSPVPVDVLSAEDISKTGTDDLLMQLQGSIPSLNVHLQPISDAASMIRPANLRGLSADSTLITVNGKRRHHASVIAFQGGGVNDGSQGADISVIPAIALKRVEVLRDGASAQYGSDAIAGVINFVLDDISEGGSLSYKMGEYTEGDGATTTIAGKYGLPLGQDGFLTTSFQIRQADDTSRTQQRPDAAALIAAGNTAVASPAQIWGAPKIDDDVTFFLNAGVNNSDGSESYMFGNYSERDVDGGFYYRNPDGRDGVFTIGDYRAVGNIDGTCAYGTGASGQVDPSDYALRDAMDSNILAAISAGATVTTGMGTTSVPIDIGFTGAEVDPLNQMSLAAKELDEANAPEDGRWFVAAPEWYNELANTSSKLLSVDFNAGQGSIRNGLVASGLLRGFQMYKSNNLPTNDLSGASPAGSATAPVALFGHISATSAASAMNKVETIRDTGTFSDIVRGLMVWGRKVLRPEITGKIIYTID